MLETASKLQGAAHRTRVRICQGLSKDHPLSPHQPFQSFLRGGNGQLWKCWVWGIYRDPDTPAVSLTYYWPDSSVHKMNNLPKAHVSVSLLFIIMNWDRSNSPLCWSPGLNLSRLGWSPTVYLSGGAFPLWTCGPDQGLCRLRCAWEEGAGEKTDWWMSGQHEALTAPAAGLLGTRWWSVTKELSKDDRNWETVQCVLRKCIIIFSIHLHRT